MSRALQMAALCSLACLPILDDVASAQHVSGVSGYVDFTREVIFSRFDMNRDGRLDREENAAMRDAFDGVDVPILPTRAYNYVDVELPTYVEPAELQSIDSTPAENPLTSEGATLGRVLFYDVQLSKNNTIACASCHHQKYGFTDPRRLSTGYEGGQTSRNAMPLANLRYTNLKGQQPGFFWDERAPSLEAQALMPIQDEIEMGMELTELVSKLSKLPYYPPLFATAFGSTEITSERIARAIAQFMRCLVSFDSKFDRAAQAIGSDDYAAEFDSFTREENLGKSLFINGVGGIAELGCAHCHVPPTFGMPTAMNNGLDSRYQDPGLGALDRPSNDPFTPSNHGKFKAPSLRNIELTAPFMHDGRFKTLEEVVQHYSNGVHPHENLGLAFEDEASVQGTSGFNFTDSERAALIAFLKTLTDNGFVSDPKFSDPFVR